MAATWGQMHVENTLNYCLASVFPSHDLLWLDTTLMCTISTSLEWCGRNMNIAGLHSICCGANAFHCLWELVPSLLMHPHPSTKPLSIVWSIRMYSIRKESVPCKLLFCSWLQWFVEVSEVGLSKEIQSCNLIKSYHQRQESPSAAPSLFTLILLHYSLHAFLGGTLFLSPANFQGCLVYHLLLMISQLCRWLFAD